MTSKRRAGLVLVLRVATLNASACDRPCRVAVVCPLKPGPAPAGGFLSCADKKGTKEAAPASTPRASRTVPCAARSIGCLRNSPSLRSVLEQCSPPPHCVRRNPMLLCCSAFQRGRQRRPRFPAVGLSLRGCRSQADIRGAFGRNVLAPDSGSSTLRTSPKRRAADGFDFGSRQERQVAEHDREEGRGLSEHRAQRGRVPQAPGRASNAGKSGAMRLTANAGRHSLLTFWCCCQKVRRPPGRDPAYMGKPSWLVNSYRRP